MAEEEIFSVVLDARMAAFEKQMLQAANKTDQNLNRIEKKMAHANNRLRKGLTFGGLDARGERAFKDLERRFAGLRGTALGGLAALGVGFGGAELVRALREEEEAARRLGAVLKSTGHAAGLSQQEIAQWADALEVKTGRSAAEIQTVAAQLATFTSIGRNEFLKAIEVADDLAATFGGDLQSNLDAVARALDDPIKGFGNLQKRGFALADAELKRVKAHLAAGESAKAQGIILENLSKQVSGAAEATNQGLTKALNDLKKAAGDAFKAMAERGGTDAATAAIEAVTKGVHLLESNMGTLVSVSQAAAAFFATRWVASMVLAKDGLVMTSIAAVRAKGSVEALNAVMRASPAVIVAATVAALSFAMLEQHRRTQELEASTKRYNDLVKEHDQMLAQVAKNTKAVGDASAGAVGGIDAMCDAVDRAADAMWTLADAQKEVLRTNIMKQIEDNREQIAGLSKRSLMDNVQLAGEILGGNGSATAYREADRRQAIQQLERQNADLMSRVMGISLDPDGGLRRRDQNTTEVEYTPKVDKNAAKQAEQRKRLLEDLKAQTALEVAQLDEQVAKVRELERQAEITARIRQLEDAGFKAAQARAISGEVQTKLDEARARAMEREEGLLKRGWDLDIARLDENWATVRAIEEEVEKRELVAALAKVTADETSAIAKAESMLAAIQSARVDAAKRGLDLAREEHRLAVAQLSGNRELTKQLQDQAAIRERTKAYQAEGYGLKPADAERRATEEVTRERAAATYGEHRELFATAFSDGIRAAMTGDLQGFLSNQFGNFADTMMQKAGEQIFDAMFGGVDAVAEGVSQGAAIAATVTPAITGAGAAAGATMAASITAAGAAAGASMAAAIAGANMTKFPLFDQGGYTGPGGVKQAAGIVHKGEVVFSQKDVARHGGPAAVEALRRGMPGYAQGGVVGRTVIPGVNAAVNRISGASQAQQQPIIIKMAVEEGALFQPTIEAVSGRVSVQTTAMGVATVQDQQRTANMRRRQSLVG